MLDNIPDELLEHIVSFLPRAQSIARLSQSNRGLHRQVQSHGWRIFARNRFPVFNPAGPNDWADASRAFSSLVRDWDRRAFRSRYLEPSLYYTDAADGRRLTRWRRPQGQTMGFRPAIDSHEVQIGGRTHDTRQTLVWSAGSELLVRRRGPHTTHDGDWWSYRSPGAKEGRNDITTVHILKNQVGSLQDCIIVGIASGGLSCLKIPATGGPDGIVVAKFETLTDKPVQSASLLETEDRSLLAAHLSNNHITLFPVEQDSAKLAPIDRLDVTPGRRKANYIWSTRFLSPTRLMVGLGPTSQPIKVFDLAASGFSKQPIRSFSLGQSSDEVVISSVFAFEPLLGRHLGPGSEGQVFLSASMHGVKLHDMRSGRNVEQSYDDPTDDSGIYSLLSRGANRVLAGSSREAQLKVFDLRMPHPAEYSYLDNVGHDRSTGTPGSSLHDPWKLYINPLATSPFNKQHNGSRNWVYRSTRGSIYNLSSPSPWSPVVFAGVEHAVVELESCSAAEGKRPRRGPRVKDRFGEIDLPMYSMTPSMQSWEQMSVQDTCKAKGRSLLDERWRKL